MPEIYPGALIHVNGELLKVTAVTRGQYTPFKMTIYLEEVSADA